MKKSNETLFVKAGTGVVSNADRTQLDRESMRYIGTDITEIIGHQTDLILVSSGAVAAGKEKLGLESADYSDIRMQQIAAMTGNILLCQEWEKATGMVAAHDTPTQNDLKDKAHWDNLSGAIATSLKYGMLPIFNEGDARSTEELQRIIHEDGGDFSRFGDNDQLAAHLALNFHEFARRLTQQQTRVIFLTDVEGVREDPDRADSKIDTIQHHEIEQIILGSVALERGSNGGMFSKLSAAKILAEAGISVTVGAGKGEYALLNLYNYEAGTHILPKS